MTMIERVARAIDPAAWIYMDKAKRYGAVSCAMESAGLKVRSSLNRAAAAIVSMRVPTPEMYIRGGVAIYEARPMGETAADESSACWRAMIDAALEEKP